jgi:citrate lyase subunit alpha/citrate CoA-transferase
VDHIVKVDSIGDPSGILSGTLIMTDDPKGMATANTIMSVLEEAGTIRNGMSFQAGSGGVSLYMTKLLGDRLKRDGIKASFAVGGTTRYLVDMLREGTLGYLLDGQSFDPVSVESLRTDPRHIEMAVDQYANIHSGASFTEMEDVSFLSGTEVDIDFNVNVNTHSDGYLLHGIGGHQDVAFGSHLTFVTVPLKRKDNPIIKDKVLTVTTPGSLIDVVVSDAGISFNTITTTGERRQRNQDLEMKCLRSGLRTMTIDEMRKLALSGGKDLTAETGDILVGMTEYIDGSVLDSIYNVVRQ